MGTRADFYVGRGADAEWLGSVGMDGYPSGVFGPDCDDLPAELDEAGWRAYVARHIASEGHGTTPDQGWPWPWDDSGTTDYAYAFDDGSVWASNFGSEWFNPAEEPEDDLPETAAFPDMTARKNVTYGPRSGAIFLSVRPGSGDQA